MQKRHNDGVQIGASQRVINYEEKYHKLMDALRRSRMEHGDCKSGKRYGGLPKACTACMALRKIEEEIEQYKGRQVRLV